MIQGKLENIIKFTCVLKLYIPSITTITQPVVNDFSVVKVKKKLVN